MLRRCPHMHFYQCLLLLGHMVACTSITSHVCLPVRCLWMWLYVVYETQKAHLTKWVLLPPTVFISLQGYAGLSHQPPFYPRHSHHGCFPCRLGLPHTKPHTAQGLWSPREAWMYINILELWPIQHACQALFPFVRSQHIQLLSDNMTEVNYINKKGGAKSPAFC